MGAKFKLRRVRKNGREEYEWKRRGQLGGRGWAGLIFVLLVIALIAALVYNHYMLLEAEI